MKIIIDFYTILSATVASLVGKVRGPRFEIEPISQNAVLHDDILTHDHNTYDSDLSIVSHTEKLRKFFCNKSSAKSSVVESNIIDLAFRQDNSIMSFEGEDNYEFPVMEGAFSSKAIDIGALQEGTLILGRYRLESNIGKGGMGVVWKARDEVQGVDRALKFLLDKFDRDILRNEINSCQQLTHTNIVKIFEYLESGGTHFISMEYLDGISLDELIESEGVQREQAWRILENVSSALSHIHSMGMVHADLKPANIVVTKDGVAKLLDFGITRVEVINGAGRSGDAVSSNSLPHACTYRYASRSVLLGEPTQQCDDIYSLGCIAYELLSGGRHPFDGLSACEAAEKHCKPVRIKGVNARQWRAVRQALSFERHEPSLSVQRFWSTISPRRSEKRKLIYLTPLFLALAIYQPPQFIFSSSTGEYDGALQDAMLKTTKVEAHHIKIRALLESLTFDEKWEADFNNEISALSDLDGKDAPFVVSSRADASQAYISQAESFIENKKYQKARQLIARVRSWSTYTADLDRLELRIDKIVAQQAEVNRAKQARRLKLKEDFKKIKFENTLASIHNELKCRESLNVVDLSGKLKKLKSLDLALYSRAEPDILDKVDSCVSKVVKKPSGAN